MRDSDERPFPEGDGLFMGEKSEKGCERDGSLRNVIPLGTDRSATHPFRDGSLRALRSRDPEAFAALAFFFENCFAAHEGPGKSPDRQGGWQCHGSWLFCPGAAIHCAKPQKHFLFSSKTSSISESFRPKKFPSPCEHGAGKLFWPEGQKSTCIRRIHVLYWLMLWHDSYDA